MQSKLSKLQKLILIYIFENREKLKYPEQNHRAGVRDRWTGNDLELPKVEKLQVIEYQKLGFNLAENFDKLVCGNRVELIVSPSFSVSLSQSINSLHKRGLIRSYRIGNSRPYLTLTQEGENIANEIVGMVKKQKVK